MSEQEISIKAREHELYVKAGSEADEKPVKPFKVYLRETPAEPLSSTTKAILAIVSIIVGLLFLGALWRATTHHPPAVRSKNARPAVKTSWVLSNALRRFWRQGRAPIGNEPPAVATTEVF